MLRTSRIFTISLPPKLARAVDRKAREHGLGRSEILRTAFLRYLKDEEQEQRFQEAVAARARQMGIKTEDDIEALIDSVRR